MKKDTAAAPGGKKKENIHEGHRRRMYEKAEKIGYENLPEHELLEIMLYSVIRQGNTNPIAHNLIDKFGSLYGVLMADAGELKKVKGVGERTADFLHCMPKFMKAAAKSRHFNSKGKKSDAEILDELREYVLSQYLDAVYEQMHVLYLDPSLRVIKLKNVAEGSLDYLAFDKAKIVREAVLCGAAYVILSHNHPSGIAFPSEADRRVTGSVESALGEADIKLLDHIIYAGNEYYSFREANIL